MLGVTPFTDVIRFLEEAVERAPLPVSSRHLVSLPLRQPGKVLGGAERPTWPSAVLVSCAAAGGERRIGSKVAAAVEIFMAALDVLDEIEDCDHSPLVEAAGVAQALNISTLLLMLAQSLLLSLTEDGITSERTLLFAKTLAEAGLAATGGQHRDLTIERNMATSYDDALQIARLKAGVLVACACTLGALVATDDPELLSLYHDWGMHYGTAAQLSNDLHDVADQEDKSDIKRQKGTLPLLYARIDERVASGTATEINPTISGALHFTWVVLEIERQHCADIADRLAARGQAAEHLRVLLGAV